MSTARLVGRGWFGEHLLSTSHVLLKATDQSLQKALEALSLVTGDASMCSPCFCSVVAISGQRGASVRALMLEAEKLGAILLPEIRGGGRCWSTQPWSLQSPKQATFDVGPALSMSLDQRPPEVSPHPNETVITGTILDEAHLSAPEVSRKKEKSPS